MRRAFVPLLFASLVACFPAGSTPSYAQGVDQVDAIGLIDYTQPPRFKVGDFVRYHITGSSAKGARQNYTMTVLIAGEEIFWGDHCFWLETWCDGPGESPLTAATLMSYSIFQDSLAEQHMQTYRRKMLMGLDEDGQLIEQVTLLGQNAARKRELFGKPVSQVVDTLGREPIETKLGRLQAVKLRLHLARGTNSVVADSSSYNEDVENRLRWMCMDVPITHIAHEEIEKLVTRKSWMVGRSQDAASTIIRDRGLATADLVEVGHGLKGRMLPEARQKSIAQWLAAERATRPAGAARKR